MVPNYLTSPQTNLLSAWLNLYGKTLRTFPIPTDETNRSKTKQKHFLLLLVSLLLFTQHAGHCWVLFRQWILKRLAEITIGRVRALHVIFWLLTLNIFADCLNISHSLKPVFRSSWILWCLSASSVLPLFIFEWAEKKVNRNRPLEDREISTFINWSDLLEWSWC